MLIDALLKMTTLCVSWLKFPPTSQYLILKSGVLSGYEWFIPSPFVWRCLTPNFAALNQVIVRAMPLFLLQGDSHARCLEDVHGLDQCLVGWIRDDQIS